MTAGQALRLAARLARAGHLDSARALVRRHPGPVAVIEVDQTTPAKFSDSCGLLSGNSRAA